MGWKPYLNILEPYRVPLEIENRETERAHEREKETRKEEDRRVGTRFFAPNLVKHAIFSTDFGQKLDFFHQFWTTREIQM